MWIETYFVEQLGDAKVSHPFTGVWIETFWKLDIAITVLSHPFTGVWIETITTGVVGLF